MDGEHMKLALFCDSLADRFLAEMSQIHSFWMISGPFEAMKLFLEKSAKNSLLAHRPGFVMIFLFSPHSRTMFTKL